MAGFHLSGKFGGSFGIICPQPNFTIDSQRSPMIKPRETVTRKIGLRPLAIVSVCIAVLLAQGCTRPAGDAGSQTDFVVISVISTNDVHGQLLPVDGNRGLALFGGYVNNLREMRAENGGAAILIDAGDMWQGTLESNLTEGASIVDAFNQLGYVAATVGNHEFDFGPAGEKPIPETDADDPQGALVARAAEAEFAMLAANIIDTATGETVDWPGIQPTTLIDVANVKIGIVGILSESGLQAVIAANAPGLHVASLVETITAQAQALRDSGAEIVIVAAHAGGRCESFEDPNDVSSCNMDGEIMRVAQELPRGLVDQIVAGHTHQGIAHEVNGIAITESFSRTTAFGRVDYTFDVRNRKISKKQIFPPQAICAYQDESSPLCAGEDDPGTSPATYVGKVVVPDAGVMTIANRAAAYADEIKSEKLGVFLDSPFAISGETGSALGHLFMDGVLAFTGGDVLIHNVRGGLRAGLPQGELTYGSVYETFPFDNRVVSLEFSGAQLRGVIAAQAVSTRRVEFSGMRVFATCIDGGLDIQMQRLDGSIISDDEQLTVMTTDYLAMGGVNVIDPVQLDRSDYPLMREVFVDWLRAHGGVLNAEQFLDTDSPRWNLPGTGIVECKIVALD